MPPEEIITRRNLPHWYVNGAMHFVTYRLAGTIPSAVLLRLREQRDARLRQKPRAGITLQKHKELAHKLFFAEYDRHLDHSCSINWLTTPSVAAMIRGNLYHHNGNMYYLLAYCIMPNHVHVLLQPTTLALTHSSPTEMEAHEPDEKPDSGSPLSSIMHSLKSYTAHRANELLSRSGPFWQHESYDHWVRDDDELERIVYYIAWNPVKAGLVQHPHEWFFCSAHDRFLQDGSSETFLAEPKSASAYRQPATGPVAAT